MNGDRISKNLDILTFEDAKDKEIADKDYFVFEVICELTGKKHLYKDNIIGAIDRVSRKYQIICSESYQDVFKSVCEGLQRLYL